MSRLDRLQELAEKATPGPWKHDGDGLVWSDFKHNADHGSGEYVCDTDCNDMVVEEDAQFIAAANPQTILSLIATVRALTDKGAFQFANECWGCGIDQRLLNDYGHADDCPYKVAVDEWNNT